MYKIHRYHFAHDMAMIILCVRSQFFSRLFTTTLLLDRTVENNFYIDNDYTIH